MPDTLLIVDGSNLAHRCRHVFSLSYKGLDVSVLYGFLRTLYSVMQTYDPTAVIVCWDGGVPAFRYQAIPTYKRHTHADDPSYPDFLDQLDQLGELLPTMGVLSLRRRGTEADDLMYAAAAMLPTAQVVIMTTDRDLYQALALPHVRIYNPSKEEEVTRETFEAVSDGVKYFEWTLYRAMVGDSSDGVPGVVGVGHKKALALLRSIDHAYSFVTIVTKAQRTLEGVEIGISKSDAQKLVACGIEGFANTLKATALAYDRCGARLAVWEALPFWTPCEVEAVRGFLASLAFVSLMEPEFYRLFGKLQSPQRWFVGMGLRYPRVWDYTRYPIV